MPIPTFSANPSARETRPSPLVIGLSACLSGEACRYDGRDALMASLTRLQARPELRLVFVCPETSLGLPTPRAPIRLVGPRAHPALLQPESGLHHEEDMRRFASGWIQKQTSGEGLHGFILKSRSPSCGLGDTKRWPVPNTGEGPGPIRDGTGLFAASLQARLPGLPLADELALSTVEGEADFLARVRAYATLAAT